MRTDDPLKAIVAYLKKQHVLTLCTGDAQTLWCANCFYVLNEPDLSLYMLTDHTTRHGILLAENQHVAGTISDQTVTISLIKGIQYSGEVNQITGDAAQTARKQYTARFPLAKLATSPIWRLRLDEIKLTNNKLGFGTKLSWKREDDEADTGLASRQA
ncbi:YhbP family protein [Sodalis sp. C49]|uniref:YhbP family protein n=1 Tax=unclassified Sodalis (in: enterobacteria) TaxID=2636512 RepID=UPI0039659EA0